MFDTPLDEIARQMRALRIRGGPDEEDHINQDNLLVEMCRILADKAGYDVADILADYEATSKWYA